MTVHLSTSYKDVRKTMDVINDKMSSIIPTGVDNSNFVKEKERSINFFCSFNYNTISFK